MDFKPLGVEPQRALEILTLVAKLGGAAQRLSRSLADPATADLIQQRCTGNGDGARRGNGTKTRDMTSTRSGMISP